MSIKSFKNQGSFTGVLDVDTFGVSTFNNGLDANQQKSALLFDGDADKEVDVQVPALVITDAASTTLSATYTFDIDEGYDGEVFAVINKDRLSVQFTYNTAVTIQTPTAASYDSVSPEIRRLVSLGYV